MQQKNKATTLCGSGTSTPRDEITASESDGELGGGREIVPHLSVTLELIWDLAGQQLTAQSPLETGIDRECKFSNQCEQFPKQMWQSRRGFQRCPDFTAFPVSQVHG